MTRPDIKISVIIPAYNVEEYIGKCIQSVRSQLLQEIEIILVNDGSKDGTLQICRESATADNRIQVLNQKNQGLSAARNAGAQEAKGEYIFFLDGDDWIESEMLSTMYDEAIAADADVVICDFNYRYSNRQIITKAAGIPPIYNDSKEGIIRSFLTGRIMIAATNKIFRRSFYINNSFSFPLGYLFEDIPLIKLISNANRMVYINKPFYNYRQREGSIMRTLNEKIIGKCDLVKDIEMYIKENGLFERLKMEYQNFYNDVILLQLVNNCLTNGGRQKKARNELIARILKMEDTKLYLKGVHKNKFINGKYKMALILLRFAPKYYKLLFQMFGRFI